MQMRHCLTCRRQVQIKQNLDRVVAGNPVLGNDLHTEGLGDGFLKATLDSTDGSAGLEPVDLAHPVNAAAGNQHVADKDNLKEQEEQAAHDLSVVEVTETENQERELDCPVALGESGDDVGEFFLDTGAEIFDQVQESNEQTLQPLRYCIEEQLEIVNKGIKFAQFQILQII